ncbi:MAG: di-trans,poly-cis-decaprenylcistransferase [Deltaproteobacteria bacterium]|nr:di-trans,poly-cis-decaprenylcistransferase [Deltaproteobacteria bacterium]
MNLPEHVAIIMGGNGRWARARGLNRIEGHRTGIDVSEKIITAARDIGIRYLTLYAFSKENWERPPEEVAALMRFLKAFLLEKRQKMLDNRIKLNAIGDLSRLPADVYETLAQVMRDTGDKRHEMVLTLALSYGSRDEIVRAAKKILAGGPLEKITEEAFGQYLDTRGLPDVDLVIRTSGEHRVSNFLLWQGAYAEYVFEECFWPEFTKEHLMRALEEYRTRERRYGKISEQL